jgi:hypothetical protein
MSPEDTPPSDWKLLLLRSCVALRLDATDEIVNESTTTTKETRTKALIFMITKFRIQFAQWKSYGVESLPDDKPDGGMRDEGCGIEV